MNTHYHYLKSETLNSARLIFDQKRCLGYYSRSIQDGVFNLNKQVQSLDGKDIACRHLAYYAYMNDLKMSTINFTSKADIEKIQPLKHNIYDQFISNTPNSGVCSKIESFFKDFIELTHRIEFEKDSLKKILLFTVNHVFAVSLKATKSNLFKITIYDPNYTNISVKLVSHNLNNFKKLNFKSIFPKYFNTSNTVLLKSFNTSHINSTSYGLTFSKSLNSSYRLGWAIRTENICELKKIINKLKNPAHAYLLSIRNIDECLQFPFLSPYISLNFFQQFTTLVFEELKNKKTIHILLTGSAKQQTSVQFIDGLNISENKSKLLKELIK